MKNEKQDERIVKLLDGSTLSVEKIREFTAEETETAIRSILAEKSKGVSVRRAIFNLAEGNDKLMLRLQNKYRNMLKKEPRKIAQIAAEMGLEEDATRAERKALLQEKGEKACPLPDKAFLKRRLENEINALYDRLGKSLKEENERLRVENAALRAENERLRLGKK